VFLWKHDCVMEPLPTKIIKRCLHPRV